MMCLLLISLVVLGCDAPPTTVVPAAPQPTPVPTSVPPTPIPNPPTHVVRVTDFSAVWCGPCRQFRPVFESWISKYSAPGVTFREVDIDVQPLEARKYGVRSIPTIIIEQDGQVVKTWVGPPSEATFAAVLQQFRE